MISVRNLTCKPSCKLCLSGKINATGIILPMRAMRCFNRFSNFFVAAKLMYKYQNDHFTMGHVDCRNY